MSVKTIKFNVTLKGHGVVQTGGDEKGLTYLREDVDTQKFNNVVYAKGNFKQYTDESGKKRIRKILKISGDGLRHAIHRDSMPANTPSILLSPEARIFATASLDMLIRGWLSTSTDERKRSAYTITAAEDEDARLNIELFANSAPKTKREDSSEEASDTSLFARETTGDTCYNAAGFIDIEELRFISISDIYGRRAINDDMAELYRAQLSENLGSEVDVPRYWKRKRGSSNIPERGILLNDAQVTKLVTHLLQGIANIHIVKSASGFAQTAEVTISPISGMETAIGADKLSVFDGTTFNDSVIPTEYASAWEEITEAEGRARVERTEVALAAEKKAQKDRKAAKKDQKEAKTRGGKRGAQGAPETPADYEAGEE